jgi:hypothetical protein
MAGSAEADEGRDEAEDDEQIAFGQSPPEEFDLPPEDEVDEDDVARISLRGEGDWMHPDDDEETGSENEEQADSGEDEPVAHTND